MSLTFGYIKFEVSLRYPVGNANKAGGYVVWKSEERIETLHNVDKNS